jgi:hypothetical protein
MGATVTTRLATSRPSAASNMQHTWLIALMIIFLLLLIGFIVFLGLAAGEEICLDRWPWWGPPENPDVYSSCSGHIYERLQ